MADNSVYAKGLDSNDGKRGVRMEIDEFIEDNEVTNLFLIALAELQRDNFKDWFTFYAVAGIHGAPRDQWGEYPNNIEDYGYCKHSSNNFPTWHRPYMNMYEYCIYNKMKEIAEQYQDGDKQVYLEAAARFRLPFWDIVMPRLEKKGRPETIWACPQILKATDVYVKLPKPIPGKTGADGFTLIPNPMYSYTFPSDAEMKANPNRRRIQFHPAFLKTHTTRNPTPTTKGDTNTTRTDEMIQGKAVAAANEILQMLNPDQKGQRVDGGGKTDILVNVERSWETFANHNRRNEMIAGQVLATNSVEGFHDGIHNVLGSGIGSAGHMGNPVYAAFDPIFWLHHNNVERLFCLYQALYPDKWVSDEDLEDPFYPFMTGNGTDVYNAKHEFIREYWNSGFAIPGTVKPPKQDIAEVRRILKEYLTKTYLWATEKNPTPSTLDGWPRKKAIDASWALNGSNAVVPAAPPTLHLSALALADSGPALVARTVHITEDIEVKDRVVPVEKVVDAAQEAAANLPAGALSDLQTSAGVPIQYTWNAHVTARKFAFDGSYSIHVFIGHVKDDQPERYFTKKNEVGFVGVFASPPESGCAECKKHKDNDLHIEGVVPLTSQLYDYLDACPGSEGLIRDGEKKTCANLSPEEVVPFLKEHIKWRMIDTSSALLGGQEEQADLEITVSSRQYVQPTVEFPMGAYGPPTIWPEITSGKPGGFTPVAAT